MRCEHKVQVLDLDLGQDKEEQCSRSATMLIQSATADVYACDLHACDSREDALLRLPV